MTSVAQVRVNLPGRAYDILIGAGELDRLDDHLATRIHSRRATIITDSHVGPFYLSRAAAALVKHGIDVHALTIPAGEPSKSSVELSRLYDELSKRRHGRDEPVIALGGGVVGDLAGFAAATWQRGVPFVQCPTTMEADIDASIGGKTAINHSAGKNLIGAIHQPILVCIDVTCLSTLTRRDLVAGLSESIKHAIAFDAPFFAWHESNVTKILAGEPATMVELVRRNCEIKARVVEEDERESATSAVGRAALNFGHTIGHAIEAEGGYSLRHGEAVALGMVAEMEIAVRCARMAPEARDKAGALIAAMGLPTKCPIPMNTESVFARLATDKKVKSGKVRYVVPNQIGCVEWLADAPDADVRHAISSVMSP